jgi:hypothetical protein
MQAWRKYVCLVFVFSCLCSKVVSMLLIKNAHLDTHEHAVFLVSSRISWREPRMAIGDQSQSHTYRGKERKAVGWEGLKTALPTSTKTIGKKTFQALAVERWLSNIGCRKTNVR